MPKNIVLCSDGTGNTAILGRGTNVFKLYEAVDLRSDPSGSDQVAFYGDGVGTESFKWLRLLTGALGLGLRKNVCDLYKQLVRVYEKDDRIYLFGFSRGAYTVRMLAGVIAHCGIINLRNLKQSAELDQAANEALKVLLSRFVRTWFHSRHQDKVADKAESNQAAAAFHDKYKPWLPDAPGRPGVRIRFIGVWDTVEAYGFPMEEVAGFVDRVLIPYRFPDTYLSGIVDTARQALSIDDERKTFAPVLWQGCLPNSHEPDPRIKQVWFAGVHANVGGGYPKQGMSLVALTWMMQEAEKSGLRFIQGDRRSIEEHQDVYDKLYDSRAGLAASFYKYFPRDMQRICEKAHTTPILHASVLDRLRARTEEYAPAQVPRDFDVEPPQAATEAPDDAQRRFAQLEYVKDAIWWRRVAYFLIVYLCVGTVAFAVLHRRAEPFPDIGAWSGLKRSLYVLERPLIDFVDWVTPDLIQPELNAFRHNPDWTLILVGAIVITWVAAGMLRDYSRRLSYRAWRGSLPDLSGKTFPATIDNTIFLRVGRWFRTMGRSKKKFLVAIKEHVYGPIALLLMVVFVIVVLWNWIAPAVSIGSGDVEPASAAAMTTIHFDTRNSLQSTGIFLERGQRYRIEVVEHSAWLDRNLKASPEGVLDASVVQSLTGHMRRDPRYPWFMLLGSIGPDPSTTFPIGLKKEFRADHFGRLHLFVNDVYGFYDNNRGTAEIRVQSLDAKD